MKFPKTKRSNYIKKLFDKRWVDFFKGYKELKKKIANKKYNLKDENQISQIHRAMFTYEMIKRNYKKGSKILDLGCGNGFLTFFLNKKKYSAIGFDYSQTAIDQGIEIDNEFNLGLKNKIFVDDLNYLKKIKKNSIHAVVALGVMRYLDKKSLDLVYRNVHRILKKNGSFIVSNENELFDIYALNDGTEDFWVKKLSSMSSSKKLFSEKLLRKFYRSTFNLPRRSFTKISVSKHVGKHLENPLTYSSKVKRYGYELKENIFPDPNILPPLIEKKINKKKLYKLKSNLCLEISKTWIANFMGSEMLSRIIKK